MEDWAQSWLAQLCKMIAGVSRGLLALGPPGTGPLVAAASWPDGSVATETLLETAELALAERRGVVQAPKTEEDAEGPANDQVAIPLLVDGQLLGAIAVEVPSRPEPQQRALMKLLQWGSIWLEILIRHLSTSNDRLAEALDVVSVCLEHGRFHAAATAVVTELARRLDCERVSVGFVRGAHIRVHALSHSAKFGSKTNLISQLGDAMDEARDQQATVVYPPPRDGPPQLIAAHEQLSGDHGAAALCTVPLSDSGAIIGGLTLERTSDRPFDPQTVELCEHMGSLIGPILDLKRKEDRWLADKVWDSLRLHLRNLLGPEHVVLKVGFGLSLALLVFLTLARGDYRVGATARLEGTNQRAIVAAVDGFISSADARAGDLVRKGDPLGALDDRDLKLERLKWSSKRDQLVEELRGALASHDAVQVRILGAQVDQAEAHLELLDEQLARTRMIAPFDGIVVSGDLSQLLGSPVEKGRLLFEIAPLEGYRVVLEVDEREISRVRPGQRGRLALPAMPGLSLPLVVEKVTPVSTAQEGRNFFRVEARLEETPGFLRPGMEGIGKIEIERRSLGWIWTHSLVDWLRLWTWSWWP